MDFITFGVKRPVFGSLLMWFLVIGGVAALLLMRREFFPAVEPEAARIAIIYPGASPAEVEEANKVDVGALRDPQTLAERTKPGKENWLITLGVCTHLGCVPLGAAAGEVKGEYGGYFCPCHGSHYDTAARIRKGPAPTNLVVPEFAFISDTVVKIG